MCHRSIFLFMMVWVIFFTITLKAANLHVGLKKAYKSIKAGLEKAQNGDTLYVHAGIYREGNIMISKQVKLIGIEMPIIDGDRKYEVISIKSDNVLIRGFKIQHSGYATLDDPGGIKVYESKHVVIENNHLYDNFFGIYLQYSSRCTVRNNLIQAFGKEEQEIGNGIHCWKCDSIYIIGNTTTGNRDGIYFEFVTKALVWRNIANRNIRYGLHFMFSNDNAYHVNVFKQNGAGVAVMFSKRIDMTQNLFSENWGDAAYGLLLKEISNCRMQYNRFENNTIGVFMDGANRFLFEKNSLKDNGWGIKLQANCMDNILQKNNFEYNTFDMATNGDLVLNTLQENYWDKYTGFDLDKNKLGDVPFHPLSLFGILVENNPNAMLLFRSFIITLLDKSEKMIPSITPDGFADKKPSILKHKL